MRTTRVLTTIVATTFPFIALPAMAQGGIDETTPEPPVAQPVAATDSSWQLTASSAIESTWLFKEQLQTVAGPSAQLDLTACKGDICLDVWHQRELGNSRNQETDLSVSVSKSLGTSLTIDGTAAVYLIQGDNAFSLEAGITQKLDEHTNVRVSFQMDRGGFTENLPMVDLNTSYNLASHVELDAQVAAFYSNYAGSAGVQFTTGLTYSVTDAANFRLYAAGYAGGGKEDAMVGLSFNYTF